MNKLCGQALVWQTGWSDECSRAIGQKPKGLLGIWRNLCEDGGDLAPHAPMQTPAQLTAAQAGQRRAKRDPLS